MRLRPSLVSLPLDGELVVFSDDAQRLVGLNESAALVFRKLQDGTPPAGVAQYLVSEGLAPSGQAEHWVATTLEALGSHGMLADGGGPAAQPTGPSDEDRRRIARMLPYAPFQPVTEKRYRLLETCVLIRFAHLAQVRLVDAVIGHLVTDNGSEPTVVIEIQATILDDGHLRSDVFRDGSPFAYAPRLSMLGPLVKAALWQSTVNAHDFLFYIHAGVVGTGTSCIILPAAAGSGKSSLTAALTHDGFRYYSDEVVLIERTTFQVPPLSLAICSKATGWDVMARYYPAISSLPMHQREDGKVVRYIPPPADAAYQPPVPVSHIFFPRYQEDNPTELKPVARAEALSRLMSECLALGQRLDESNVGELVRWIAGIEGYALTFSSLEEAVQVVRQVTIPSKI